MKRIIVTPAGRQATMSILAKYLARDHAVGEFDEWHIWVNTEVPSDLRFFDVLASDYPWIKLVNSPYRYKNEPLGFRIHSFYPFCMDPDAVYLRMDDDIVFIEPGSIRKLLEFRLANPDYFLVYGNIVNNSICSYLHQHTGAMDHQFGFAEYQCTGQVNWKSPDFAEHVHRCFMRNYAEGRLDRYKFNRWLCIQYERVSINVCSYFGKDIAAVEGKADPDEEQWLSVDWPKAICKRNIIMGDGLFVHFSYFTTWNHMLGSGLLEEYEELSRGVR